MAPNTSSQETDGRAQSESAAISLYMASLPDDFTGPAGITLKQWYDPVIDKIDIRGKPKKILEKSYMVQTEGTNTYEELYRVSLSKFDDTGNVKQVLKKTFDNMALSLQERTVYEYNEAGDLVKEYLYVRFRMDNSLGSERLLYRRDRDHDPEGRCVHDRLYMTSELADTPPRIEQIYEYGEDLEKLVLITREKDVGSQTERDASAAFLSKNRPSKKRGKDPGSRMKRDMLTTFLAKDGLPEKRMIQEHTNSVFTAAYTYTNGDRLRKIRYSTEQGDIIWTRTYGWSEENRLLSNEIRDISGNWMTNKDTEYSAVYTEYMKSGPCRKKYYFGSQLVREIAYTEYDMKGNWTRSTETIIPRTGTPGSEKRTYLHIRKFKY